MLRKIQIITYSLIVLFILLGARWDCDDDPDDPVNETEEIIAISYLDKPIIHQKQISIIDCGDQCIRMLEDFEGKYVHSVDQIRYLLNYVGSDDGLTYYEICYFLNMYGGVTTNIFFYPTDSDALDSLAEQHTNAGKTPIFMFSELHYSVLTGYGRDKYTYEVTHAIYADPAVVNMDHRHLYCMKGKSDFISSLLTVLDQTTDDYGYLVISQSLYWPSSFQAGFAQGAVKLMVDDPGQMHPPSDSLLAVYKSKFNERFELKSEPVLHKLNKSSPPQLYFNLLFEDSDCHSGPDTTWEGQMRELADSLMRVRIKSSISNLYTLFWMLPFWSTHPAEVIATSWHSWPNQGDTIPPALKVATGPDIYMYVVIFRDNTTNEVMGLMYIRKTTMADIGLKFIPPINDKVLASQPLVYDEVKSAHQDYHVTAFISDYTSRLVPFPEDFLMWAVYDDNGKVLKIYDFWGYEVDIDESYSEFTATRKLISTRVDDEEIREYAEPSIPENFTLEQNYPNPFNPVTAISFKLDEPAHVKLEITNLLGQRVATLVKGQLLSGIYEYTWDATGFPSGAYFYRITVDGTFTDAKKMMLVK